jgi:hypothetical protein
MNIEEKLNSYLTEKSNNMDISKQIKSIADELLGTAKKVKTGDFPYESDTIKEALEQDFIGYKKKLDVILKKL